VRLTEQAFCAQRFRVQRKAGRAGGSLSLPINYTREIHFKYRDFTPLFFERLLAKVIIPQ